MKSKKYIKVQGKKRYWALSCDDHYLDILNCIFENGISVESLIEDLFNPQYKWLEGNRYSITILDKDYVIVEDLHAPEDYEYYVKISKKDLSDLIKSWYELVEKQPDEIIMYRDGDKYWVEPVFYN